jgi:hypothetical protein
MTVNQNEVFDKAVDMFAVMSTPIRLRIISALCQAVCTQVAIGMDVNDQTNKEFV